ncbi:MAG: SDR family oxidoreductase [Clostridia bacterium]|nr:SDR family oxidoreductase [Clostridia bacterium]
MERAVFITGACVGTGYVIAEKYAGAGWNVIITGRDGKKAAASAENLAKQYGVKAIGYECNIRNEAQVKNIFSDIDKKGLFVETLILNAANLGFRPENPAAGQDFWTVPVEEFAEVFETNLVWNFTIARQAAFRMKEMGKGSIVFIGSNTSKCPIPNRTAYCASKGGINSLSASLAIELGPYGIRSNVILPGTIKTKRWEEMNKGETISGNQTPIGDIADFEDIANAAYYLGTSLAKNVTGAELLLDGGMSRQLFPRK